MAKNEVEASLTASDTYTDPIKLGGKFMIEIDNTWTGTITLYRSYDNQASWKPVDTWTSNGVFPGEESEDGGAEYKIGFGSGDWGSGQADVRLSN